MLKKLTLILALFSLASCTVTSPTSPTTSWEVTFSPPPKLELIDISSVNNGQTTGTWDAGYYADYPIFTGSYVSDAIRTWLDSEVAKFERDAKDVREYMPDLKPEFSAVFDIHTGSNLTAITYEIYTWAGGAHGQDTSRSFVVDQAGRWVKFSDLFVDYEKNLGAIKTAITESVKKSGTGVFDMMDEGIDQFLSEPNFSISGSTVILMFQKYQVAPGSEGLQYIPLTASGLLKSEFHGSFDYTNTTPSVPPEQKKWANIELQLLYTLYAAEWTKYIALTFDDGPSKANTPQLLDTLKKYGAKATFYVLGKNTSYFPEIVKRASSEGHEIGSHTWDHPQLTRLSRGQMISQRDRTDAAIRGAIGTRGATMRPPYGSYNATVREVFARPIILWDVDTLDWKHRNVSKNISIATSSAHDGAIILFHDIHTTSVASIESVVKRLQSKWYVFVTVSELLKIKNGGKAVTGGVVCTSGGKCK